MNSFTTSYPKSHKNSHNLSHLKINQQIIPFDKFQIELPRQIPLSSFLFTNCAFFSFSRPSPDKNVIFLFLSSFNPNKRSYVNNYYLDAARLQLICQWITTTTVHKLGQ